MPAPPAHPDPVGDPELPAELVEALGGLYASGATEVPAAVDAAVLREARTGVARRRRLWLYGRIGGAVAAAGAAAAVVVVAYLDRDRATPTPMAATQGAAAVAGDVDGSGRVDVLDAFRLARRVRAAPGAPAPGEDVNGDGTLDARDVDAVAAMAVRLDAPARGGPQ